MLQRIKCFFGLHREVWLGCEKPFYRQILMKCDCCGKYNLWNAGRNTDYWTKDINNFPKEVVDHIKKHNL